MSKRWFEPGLTRDPRSEPQRRMATVRRRRGAHEGNEDGDIEEVSAAPVVHADESSEPAADAASSERERMLVWAAGATVVGGAMLAASGADASPSVKAGPVTLPPDPTPDPKPDPEPDLKPDPRPDPKPDLKPDSKPDPKPDPQPALKPDPLPEPKPDPGPDPIEAPLKPPRLTLVEDTGTPGDGITRRSDIEVDTRELRDGAVAELSLDGGLTWVPAQARMAVSDLDEHRPDGHWRVLARQRVPSGEVSAALPLGFVMDRTAPEPPRVVFQPTTLRDRGTGLRDPGYVVLQPSEPGTLKWCASQAGTAPGGQQHHGAVRLPDGLPASAGQISAVMVDEAGNESRPTPLLVELTPPIAPQLFAERPVQIGTPATDIVMHRGERLAVTELEQGARWEFSIDGRPWLPGHGDAITHELLWEKGAHVVRVMQFDSHGNESDVSGRTVEVADSLRVALRRDTGRTDAQRADRLTYDASLDVTGLDPAVHSRWEYRINDGTWVPGNASREIADAVFKDEGKVAVQVRAFNPAGVVNAEARIDFEIDRTPPAESLHRLSVGGNRVAISGKLVNFNGAEANPDGENVPFTVVNTGMLSLGFLEPGGTWDVGVYRGGEIARPTRVSDHKDVPYEWHRGLTDAALPRELLQPGPNVFRYVVFDQAGNTQGERDGKLGDQGVIRFEFVYFIPPVSADPVPPL